MMHSREMIGNAKGFSLIEIIMVIVVASVMFAMMFAYFNQSLSQSALPVIRLNQSMGLTTVAERIMEHYRQTQTAQPLGTIRANLNIAPPNNPYGDNFAVVTNEFITFNNYNDIPAGGGVQNVLKITIRHTQTNERLTLLLTQW